MSTNPCVVAVLGRFSIRSLTRPAVWPFVRFMRLEISPSEGPGCVLVRVSTAGGAVLRSFRGQVEADSLRVRGLEADGRPYELRLSAAVDDDGRRVLVGDWLPVGGGAAVPEGGFVADSVAGMAATHAA